MVPFTLTTFNCENLMMRCDFERTNIPRLARQIDGIVDQTTADSIDAVLDVLEEDDRTLTAMALSAAEPDICAVQEVENLVTLTAFHNRYLNKWSRRSYPWRASYQGNDTRSIDVGVLSRARITSSRSHADLTFNQTGVTQPDDVDPGAPIFRRDCLEVEVEKQGRLLTLFICHFKSMNGGRKATRPVREAEAAGVRWIIEQRFDNPASAHWAVLGDFNDYLELDGDSVSDHGLGPLVDGGFAIDALMLYEPDPMKRWTHYYAAGDSYSALDHILLSPALADQNPTARTRITRGGMPLRAERIRTRRLPGVGWATPKASDHCPLTLSLMV